MLNRVAQKLFLLIIISSLSGCMKIRGVTELFDKLVSCNTSSMEGAGTASNPYQICTAAQLKSIANTGSVYSLKKDLDLTGIFFPPITGFTGKFYGNGHVISGQDYSRPVTDNIGLFDTLVDGTEVHDLVISGSRLEGHYYVGALAGQIAGSSSTISITGITVSGASISGVIGVSAMVGSGSKVVGSNLKVQQSKVVGDAYVGAVAGMLNTSSSMIDVQLDAAVAGFYSVGGFAGGVSDSSFSRVAVLADVVLDPDTAQENSLATPMLVGGMFGSISNSNVTDSYYLGSVSVTNAAVTGLAVFAGSATSTQLVNSYVSTHSINDYLGNATDYHGLIGTDGGSNTVSTSYFYQHAYSSDLTNTATVHALTLANLSSASSFSNLNFSSTWQMSSGSFSSPSLLTQNRAAPFGSVTYREASRGPVVITEVEDASGYFFPSTQTDQNQNKVLTLRNQAGVAMYLKEVSTALGKSFSPATGASAGTCAAYVSGGTALASGQTCTFGVRFQPDTNIDTPLYDLFAVKYALQTSNGLGGVAYHKLDGQGVAMTPYVEDSTLAFGNGIINQATLQDYELLNNGVGNLKLISYQLLSGTHFSVDDVDCPLGTVVNAASSCFLHVNFNPTALKFYRDVLEIVYQDTATNKTYTTVVLLNGTGVPNPFQGDGSANCLARNGSIALPFCVQAKADLEKIRDQYGVFQNKSFEQIANINMGETSGVAATCPTYDFQGIPMFQGVYDGAGFTISNLCGGISAAFVQQLYGNGVIKNLNFVNLQATGAGIQLNIDGRMTILGGVVAYMGDTSKIDHVNILSGKVDGTHLNTTGGHPNGHATGGLLGAGAAGLVTHSSVNMTVIGIQRVGGLFGYALTSLVMDHLSSAGVVTAASTMVGGLGGFANGGTTISDSFSTATVTGGPVYFGYGVGGLIGALSGTVTHSYATGVVSGETQVGGLIGFCYEGNASQSFTASAVSASSSEVGGFMGWSYGCTITDSIALSSVVADTGTKVGGFVGSNRIEAGIFTHNYALNSSFSAATAASGEKGAFIGYDDSSSAMTQNYYYQSMATPSDVSATPLANTAGSFVDSLASYAGFDTATTWRTRHATADGTLAKSPVLSWMCGQTLGSVAYVCE